MAFGNAEPVPMIRDAKGDEGGVIAFEAVGGSKFWAPREWFLTKRLCLDEGPVS